MPWGRPTANDNLQEAAPQGVPPVHPEGVPPPANMAIPRNKFEVIDSDANPVQRRRSWKKWIIIIAVAIVVLALALGLGLGLGLKNSGDNSPPSSTSTVVPGAQPSVTPSATLDAVTPWQIVLDQTVSLDNSSSASTSDDGASTENTAATALVTPNQFTNPNVTLIDIDMFLHQNLTVVQDLRARGMHVICYFSAGSYEDWRPDIWKFKSNDLGNELDGWPGEYWLDLNSDNVRSIMTSRIQIAAEMNCSGIDPDNVDGYVCVCPTDVQTFSQMIC